MAKWADFCISAVRYDTTESHIDKVRVHVDNGDTLSNPAEWTRAQVVSAIEGKRSVITVYDKDGKWRRGEDVRVIVVNGIKFIRTDTNYRAADNLGNLPRF